MFGRGSSSIRIMRLFGIPIGASPSWFVVLFLFIYVMSGYFQNVLGGSSTQAYVVAVLAAMAFFLSVVLHELGHALVARRLGIGIVGIDLWFFGGIAKLKGETDTPGTEFKVAAAGPAVTLLIVAICAGLSALIAKGAALDVARFSSDANASPTLALLGFLASINTLLFALNMVPAYPLDGGRLARAVIWRVTGDRHRATRAAGRLGVGLSYVMIGVGIYLAIRGDLTDGVYLAVVGWFLAQSARAAVLATNFSERIDGITVADIMEVEPVSMPATTTLLRAQEDYFDRYGRAFIPVVDDDGRFVGVVGADRVASELAAGRPALDVAEIVALSETDGWRVQADRPLQSLITDEHLRVRGALMAVDAEGILRGVVTAEQVRRALTAALPQRIV